MINKMREIARQIHKAIGLEEFAFLLGLALLYIGASVEFSHALAQIVTGAVLISVSMLLVFKGSHD